ncbi:MULTISPECIES: LysM peptidoglycan-binding domain-containing protein [Acinetobacter]|uniref:LysM peptidoglycan-binding domain-containing protein n=1 Tax=Acinetobacter TaxID=469 RepID=UPI001D0E58ED|nr:MULTISPECIES: LysM peptidoglycan-binding domain-containing protein [Acinetobacter]WPE81521.1 LysM peptidoglycan-binding domain-containing protein [Acinetobacter baumannii]
MNKKSLVTIQILDLFGSPISKAQYEVKNQRTGQVIAAGATNSSGCIVEISRDKGTALDVYIKSMFNGLMVKVQSFVMSRDRMLVKITSPKVMLDLKTLTNQGNSGQYKRKTHVVKKGETLFEIAQKNHTTVRALERLNKIDDPNKINIGQVIKLPVNIPATGNNSHQEKSKPATQQRTQPSATTKQKPSQTPPVKPSSTTPQKKQEEGIFGANFGSKILDQVNELYEEGKKTLNEATNAASKILTVDDRSQDGGTPKVDAPNLCKTNPQCISSGKSELIREVNIRLAGFGGALPTDEFTELTAKCIKQFQRDYMGVPETGKICGSVLAALDKFRDEYGIAPFFDSMKCPCGVCSGFGKGRNDNFEFESYQKSSGRYIKVTRPAHEYKGMHKSLIWGLKAMLFYFKKIANPNGYKITGISSGYRCIDNNWKKRRATTNHMGCALDIVVQNKNNQVVSMNELENKVRTEWFCKYLNTSLGWSTNKFGLERLSDGATTWVHLDVREFIDIYKVDNLFSETKDGLNGRYFSQIIKESNLQNLLSCSGIIPVSNKLAELEQKKNKLFDEDDARKALKIIYDKYGKEIAEIVERMYRAETRHFSSEQYKYGGTPGMEVHGSAPYYGWDSSLFIEPPTGTWSAYENKGLSGSGGNAQEKNKKKVFVCVSSVLVGMTYVSEYIKKYNGNYARWFSKEKDKQEVYRNELSKIKVRIVSTF